MKPPGLIEKITEYLCITDENESENESNTANESDAVSEDGWIPAPEFEYISNPKDISETIAIHISFNEKS